MEGKLEDNKHIFENEKDEKHNVSISKLKKHQNHRIWMWIAGQNEVIGAEEYVVQNYLPPTTKNKYNLRWESC
jgi:hypothetical protein